MNSQSAYRQCASVLAAGKYIHGVSEPDMHDVSRMRVAIEQAYGVRYCSVRRPSLYRTHTGTPVHDPQILHRRFGVLWRWHPKVVCVRFVVCCDQLLFRPLELQMSHRGPLVLALMRLHNISQVRRRI